MMMQKSKGIALSNSLQNLLFPPGRYSINQLLNITPYFNTGCKFTLQKHKELMKQIFEVEDEKLWWVVQAEYGEVDAKVLLLVLMLQLIGKERRDIFNQGANNVHKESLTSPRNKNTKSLYISTEQTNIMHFVKEHLVTFLKLLSNEPNVEDPFLEPEDLQPLNFLFKVDRNKKFASFLPIFTKSQKLKATTINDHLSPRIVISEQQLNSLEGLSYSVTVKQQMQCRDKDMRIIGCEDSEIFINSAVRSLYVVNCTNCTIYVAACQRIAFIDKCERVSFTVATNLLRVCNTKDSNIYYYGPSPIILTGDNKSVSLGPNNSTSDSLNNHIKAANIEYQESNLENFKNVHHKQMGQEISYVIMPESQFDILVLPENEEKQPYNSKPQKSVHVLAPKSYVLELEKRNKFYYDFKAKIAKSNLNPDMTKSLHSALQGNFREWLTAKGYTKNLNDLVKMLDRDRK